MANNTQHNVENTSLPNEEYIRSALKVSNHNALRIALYHQTRDPSLAAMKVDHLPVQGGALTSHAVAREHREEIREKAFDYLMSGVTPKPLPNVEEAAELMELFTGVAPTPGQVEFGYGDLAVDEFPREAIWHNKPSQDVLDEFEVTIIGAGFSGISAGIQLDRLGIKYRIIDRLSGIGGTWETNDYPEARVDISNFLYQYKFVKNYKWKSYFAPRDELKEYIDFVVDKFDVRKNISLNTSLEEARWDEDEKKWILKVVGPQGNAETIKSNVVFSASGLFNKPNIPDIPGIEKFKGSMFHTTQWDHSQDYTGKRVALIGTGSTGAQLAPQIASKASQFTIFQRTPNWVMPIHGYHDTVSEEKHWLLDNMPGYWNWFIYSNYIGSMQVQNVQTIDPEWVANGGRVNAKNTAMAETLKKYIRSQVGDRDDLYEKLVPDYPPMGRRLVIDNGWYKTLTRDNVDLVTEGIQEITETGIITTTGEELDLDMIILGAGFKVSEYLWPVNYVGRDNTTLEDLWSEDGARAYLSISMPKFPNFFMYYGPTSQVRGGSFHSWTEVTTRYITELVVSMLESGKSTVEPKQEVFEKYNADLDAAMKKMLWTRENGGDGYFFNHHGRVVTNMPWSTDKFYELIRSGDPENFDFS